MKRVLLADDVVLLAPFEQSFKMYWIRFEAACDQAVLKICTKYTETSCLSINPSQCILQLSDNALDRIESSSNLGWYSRVTEGRTLRLING